ncbi:MAG TPA: hypothetical protein VFX01_03410 [Methylophilaceae bacterium]|nr:hypothetical protein [Methylophilaceae bacterium]
MADTRSSAGVPAPNSHGGTDRLKLLLMLFGAPGAWIAQMAISEPLAAYACYPQQMPLTAPVWNHLLLLLAIVSLLCLAAALACGALAWTTWQRLRHARDATESAGDTGEGRAEFLPKLGVIASQIFIVAILFTSCAVILVEPCQPWF